jgi:hypothetical protein
MGMCVQRPWKPQYTVIGKFEKEALALKISRGKPWIRF